MFYYSISQNWGILSCSEVLPTLCISTYGHQILFLPSLQTCTVHMRGIHAFTNRYDPYCAGGNPLCALIEEAGGLEKLEQLQSPRREGGVCLKLSASELFLMLQIASEVFSMPQ